MSAAIIPLCEFLPETFYIGDALGEYNAAGVFGHTDKAGIFTQLVVPLLSSRWKAYGCVMAGLWSGLIIGWITEVYTSNAYSPV